MYNYLMENPERLKLSSNFISTKIFVGIFLCLLILFLSEYRNIEFWQLVRYCIGFISLILFLVFIITRPNIYSDNESLFLISKNKEIRVPFKNIDSIIYSRLSLSLLINGFSYKLEYFSDIDNSMKTIRVYPNFKIDFETQFISKVRSKNQNIKVIPKGLWPFN